MSVTLGDTSRSYSTAKSWDVRFRTGYFSTEDENRSGRPSQTKIPENVHVIHSMILEDRRISTKKIAEPLTISRETVGYIIHDIFDMRKLSAKWVPKCLNAGQKRERVFASEAILDN
jgi:predicted HTH transcriptional regulator